MYIDFKVTVWERVSIPPKNEEEFLQKLKAGKITSSVDLLFQLDNTKKLECKIIDSFPIQLLPIQSLGQATIACYNDDHENIFSNEPY